MNEKSIKNEIESILNTPVDVKIVRDNLAQEVSSHPKTNNDYITIKASVEEHNVGCVHSVSKSETNIFQASKEISESLENMIKQFGGKR